MLAMYPERQGFSADQPLMKLSTHRQPAGIALVIVLAFLVLISVIVVAFLSSVSSQLTASKTVANSASVQQLADSAVNVVMAQMVDATKGQASGENLAWASQPGMIRTFDEAGRPRDFYKLYSSDKMTVSGAGFVTAADIPPADWNAAAKGELYTDLNAPGVDAKGLLVYPIVDPAADGRPAPGRPSDGVKVEGFSLTSSPGFVPSKPESMVNNRAPMPVKWLYVLKDGSLQPATLASAGTVQVTGATLANPIVGRIAFWTDDESCKVNINTASEGVYWDVPRLMSMEDYGLNTGAKVPGMAISQPVQHEYQRYPGHPATTSLSAIFGNADGGSSVFPVPSPYPANPQNSDAQQLDPYYNITPRVGLPGGGGGGGSKSGSYMASNTAPVMATDTDRLYASVDELMFTPNLLGAARIPNTSTTSAPQTITKGVLEKTRFFLTASSSAPETTVFNTPRVPVWPVNAVPAKNTAYDNLLTFCSTIGGKGYGFVRSDARSSTVDYNLTAADGTKRNQILYAYLKGMTGKAIPGFGGNFLSKYPAATAGGASERDQILTYIYDYIRCTNLQDRSNGATPFTPLFVVANNGETPGAGEVLPIKIGQTQGFGRFSSVSSAGLLFYGTGKDGAGKVNKMRAMFLLMPTSPHQGVACVRGNVKFKVTQGLDALQANGVSLNFKPGGTNYTDANEIDTFGGRGLGGTDTPYVLMVYTDPTGALGTQVKSFNDADAGGDAHYKFPFFSAEDVAVDGTNPSFSFNGGQIVVEIRASDTNELVQTLNFNFPSGNFKVPGFKPDSPDPTQYYPPSKRNPGNGSVIVNEDTVVALEVGGFDLAANTNAGKAADATAGDIRMVAGLANVPANRFRAHNDYTNAAIPGAHHMMSGSGSGMNRSTFGNLARGVPGKYPSLQPDVPSRVPIGVTGGVSRATASGSGPGDWDTGWGDQKDGAHINKPDEADTQLNTFMPYATGYKRGAESANSTYFSPNRLIPSPLMFGSLPTGVQRNLPWQTLLFHPRPEDPSHPGNGTPASPSPGTSYTSPPDHLLADLFWMPVVEPYAISQPFSTSGKINLNYQIAPFTYINRATGIHAVMKSTKFAAVPVGDLAGYKTTIGFTSGNPIYIPNRRRNIDVAKTLVAFEEKFKNKQLFLSASQICEIDLVPPEVTPDAPTVAATKAAMATFWNENQLTGDNLRERPYVDLYSRLTTKSNAFTVHVRVQALKKVPGTPPELWVTGRDQVLGEYRGSSLLERYIDLNDPNLPDFAKVFSQTPNDPTLNIDQYYRMRVISKKRFAP